MIMARERLEGRRHINNARGITPGAKSAGVRMPKRPYTECCE